MAVVSRKDLERLSYEILIDYSRNGGKVISSINPFILSHDILNLSVDFTHLSKNGDILGLTSFSSVAVESYDDNMQGFWNCLDGKSILIEKDLNVYYRRGIMNFTLMHECAHHILKRTYPDTYGIKKRTYAYTAAGADIFDWDEWQADTLASYLLMPQPLIYEGMEYFDMKGQISNLSFKEKCVEIYKFNDLCDRLGCSRRALSIRFNQLGLKGDDYLQNPEKEWWDIYKDERE